MNTRLLACCAFLLLVPPAANAAERFSRAHADAASAGFHLSEFSGNFGTGLQLSSPHLLGGKLWLHLAGDLAWVQGVSATGSTTAWYPYGNFRLGVRTGRFLDDQLPIRFYSSGGVVLLVNGSRLDSDDLAWGGFGLIGFEYFLSSRSASFIELGGMGTGATADRLQGSPIYANGFTVSWGFNWYL